jgi:hypothetical protein
MKNKKIFLGIFILILVLLSSIFLFFKINKNNELDSSEDSNIEAFKEEIFNESNDFYTIKANYPIDTWDKSGEIRQVVNIWINNAREDWKIGGEIYNNQKALESKYSDMSKMQYELYIDYATATSQKLDTHSYILSKYEWTGGAHGMTSITTFNFNNNKRILIEDILDLNKYDISLTKILKRYLVSSIGKENLDENMMNRGLGLAFLDENDNFDQAKCGCDGFLFAANFQNFMILDEGIKFIMDTYQVGAGALGNPEAIIPWSELKPFLNKDFVLP